MLEKAKATRGQPELNKWLSKIPAALPNRLWWRMGLHFGIKAMLMI